LITPYSEQLVAVGVTAVDNARSLAMLSGEVQRQASMLGYLNAFYVYALTGLIVIPLVFFVKKREA
jgi:DHA2 family multidrug resistance protein